MSEKDKTVVKATDNNVYKLKKPLEYEGRIYEEFRFNFEKLNGNNMIQIENELRDRDIFVITPETDTAFQAALAARAAGVSDSVITALPIADFLAVKRKVRRFLNGME